MNEIESGTDDDMGTNTYPLGEIGLFKLVYYLLREKGDENGARIIADAIFEITAGDAGTDGRSGFAWHLYDPRIMRETGSDPSKAKFKGERRRES